VIVLPSLNVTVFGKFKQLYDIPVIFLFKSLVKLPLASYVLVRLLHAVLELEAVIVDESCRVLAETVSVCTNDCSIIIGGVNICFKAH